MGPQLLWAMGKPTDGIASRVQQAAQQAYLGGYKAGFAAGLFLGLFLALLLGWWIWGVRRD